MGTFTLIYEGDESSEHCPHALPCLSMPCGHPERPEPPLWSEMRVPPRAASLYSGEGGMATSLNHYRDKEGNCPFHQYHVNRVKYGSPKQAEAAPACHVMPASSAHEDRQVDPLWRMKWWLEECQEFVEDELVWWPLVCPLMDGSDEAMYGLMWRLMAAWWLAVKTFNPCICLPMLTVLNIG